MTFGLPKVCAAPATMMGRATTDKTRGNVGYHGLTFLRYGNDKIFETTKSEACSLAFGGGGRGVDFVWALAERSREIGEPPVLAPNII